MLRFILKRLAGMIAVLLVLTAIMFLLNRIAPTDQAKIILGPNATPAAVAAENHKLWLDRPLPVQYEHYLLDVVQGNFGESLRTHRPVLTDLGSYLPATIELAVFGMLFALILALILAVLSTIQWRGASLIRLALVGGASVPTFLLGLGFIIIFFGKLNWLPPSSQTSYFNPPTGPTGFLLIDSLIAGNPAMFADAIRHIILPALCISIGPAVAIGRILRSSLLANMNSDYARTARAKGLTEYAVLLRHGLRNSVGPALAMAGLQMGLMFAGVVVIEDIFAWPGIGYYTAQSIPAGDFPGVAGVTLVIGVAYVVINAIVDIVQAIADPRIRM
jgi:peptide/nickel transport system permease protein